MGDSIIYPAVDPREWAEHYQITAQSRVCDRCKLILTPTIPFATGRWRGLKSAPHDCGEGFDLIVAVKATKKERGKYTSIFNILGDSND